MKQKLSNNLIIVILNYMNYKLTIETLENLISQKIEFPIVVVDNYSSNNSFSELRNFADIHDRIDVIQTPKNGGYSYGNNYGIQFAEKKYPSLQYISIMNPDITLVNQSVLINLVELLENNREIVIASGVQVLNGEKLYGWDLPMYKDILLNTIPIINKIRMSRKKENLINRIKSTDHHYVEVDVISGCFFVIDYKIFKELGFFDENVFLYSEENILAYKIHKKGFKSVVSLNDYFNHNHEHKDKKLSSIKRNYLIFIKSQDYYIKNILDKRITFSLILMREINKNIVLNIKYLMKH